MWKLLIIPRVTNCQLIWTDNLGGVGGAKANLPPPPIKLLGGAPLPCSNAYVNGLLSSFEIIKGHAYYIKGASLLDRSGLIRVISVTYYESQTTSQRACRKCYCIPRTREKVKVTQFFPSDMMHVHFATHKVAKKPGPKRQTIWTT